MRAVVFFSGYVGQETIIYLLKNYPDDVVGIVTIEKEVLGPELIQKCRQFDIPINLFFNDVKGREKIDDLLSKLIPDYIILAWWPYILKERTIHQAKLGVLNLHPSLLPYNRGKHYNFWNIVEDVPFGVSIHFVTPNIDDGDIAFQRPIDKSWEDTGKSLYLKAQQEMVALFQDSYLDIRDGNIKKKKQDLIKGSFHLSKELEPASKIFLDKMYKARDIINLLRARTFAPYPGCFFEDETGKYEIRIEIKKLKNESCRTI